MSMNKDQRTGGDNPAKSVESNTEQQGGSASFEASIDVAEDTYPHAPIPETLLSKTGPAVVGDFSENSREDTAVETKPLRDNAADGDDLAMLQQTGPVQTTAQKTTAYSDPNALREEIARARASLEDNDANSKDDEPPSSEATVSMKSGWMEPDKLTSKRRITGQVRREKNDEPPWKDKELAPPGARRRRPSQPMSKVKIWQDFSPAEAIALENIETIRNKIERIELNPGDAIGDGYEILNTVGSGNIGTVYKARSKDGTGLVAIKVVHPEIALLTGIHARIQALAQTTMAVHSPVVHRIIDIGDHGGCPFVVTEWLEGRALSTVLATRGELDSTITGRVVTLVLEALEASHNNDLFHGDLQARHIFVLSDPYADPFIKVVDFGLSNLMPRQRKNDTTQPWGLAPERIEGKGSGPHTDLYGVGVLIFEMLTGNAPFQSTQATATERQRDLERQHHTKSAPSLSEHTGQALRPGLIELVSMLLSRSPQKRPATVQALRSLLQKAAANQPLDIADNSATPSPPSQSTVAYSEHSREEALAAIEQARQEQEGDPSDEPVPG